MSVLKRLNKSHTYHKGRMSELGVAIYLTLKGYQFIRWRYKNMGGEIDLIMKHKGVLCFIEVKFRRTFYEGVYSIESRQKMRIRRAAEIFMQDVCKQKGEAHFFCRFDAVIVNSRYMLTHIKDAF